MGNGEWGRAAASALLVCAIAFAQAPAEFKNPPAQYRPVLAWDCQQPNALPALKDAGFGGIAITARPEQAELPACVAAARAAGLDAWLGDAPETPAPVLVWREVPVAELQKAIADPATVAVFDVSGRGYRRVSSSSEAAKGTLLQFFMRRATRRSGTPAGFPWSRDFPVQFREANGYDLLAKLPLLAVPLAGFDAVRHDLWRTAAELALRERQETAAKLGIKLLPPEVAPVDLGPRDRNERLARAAWFAAQGAPLDRVLLLDPAGSVWAHWTPAPHKPEAVEILEQRFSETRELLRNSLRDFRVAGEQELAERLSRYNVVVVPPAFRWNEETFQLLDDFLAQNGRVIFRGSQPGVMQQLLTRRNAADTGNDPEEFLAALEQAAPRSVSISAEGIVSRHSQDARRHYFLLTNTSSRPQRPKVTVPIGGTVQEWDLSSGSIRRVRLLEPDLPPDGLYAFTVEAPARR